MKGRPEVATIVLAILFGLLSAAGCASKSTQASVSPTQAATAKPTPVKDGPRVAVQHGFDADASKVNPAPQQISVEELLAMRDRTGGKIDLANYKERRVAPFETTTFEVTGSIKSIKHEKDGDFYMVLKGKSGAEAVVEVPDPALCKGSPLLPQITTAREMLEKHYHPTEKPQALDEEITVDGVGFLGSRRKRGSGSFGTSLRLMPGTGVKFGG